jgi:uncharacterized protein (DUF58 family)
MVAEPLIDRELLEKLERLTIHWKKSFHGLVGGHNVSRYSGPGQEFLDHRHFHQGDDLRAVNWRAYLRLEKLFLKIFQVEPRTPIRLLLDSSASMAAGSGARASTKFDYARRLAAAIVYVGLVRHDTITVLPFHERLEDPHLASGGRHRFGPVTDYLSAVRAEGRTNYLDLMRQYLSTYSKSGLMIVISDFLDDADCLKPLQYASDFGHELLLIHLWDEEERSPAEDGDLTIQDAETGGGFELSLDAGARARYTEAFDLYARALEDLALRTGGRYSGLSISTPLDEAVLVALDRAGAR